MLLPIFGGVPVFGQSFTFNDVEVSAGSKQHFSIPISDGESETIIPVTVFHGSKTGPVLGITTGVHGFEYAPILAGQRLIKKIDPATLQGTVILVQIANVGSFLGRSPFINPLDDKNLNRVFPGKPDGTITERIADFISNQVIGRSDYFVDMHSGDAPEDLMSYSAYYHNEEKPEVSAKGREMAAAMGYDHVVVFNTTGKDYLKPEFPSLYCSAEAFKRNIPAVDIECGRLGMIEEDAVADIVEGILSMLGQLEMSSTEVIKRTSIAYIWERSYVSSDFEGFFYPAKESGDFVKKGMTVGKVTDFFGKILSVVSSPGDGYILYLLGTPPVNKGETLLSLAKIESIRTDEE